MALPHGAPRAGLWVRCSARQGRCARIGVLIALVLTSTASTVGATSSDVDLEAARRFDGFRLYWAGERFRRVPVTDISWFRAFGRRWWSFIYGDCEPPAGEGGCAPPFEIQDWSACVRYLDVYPGNPEAFPFRGAKAAWIPTAGSFEVYTGRTTVVIFANSRRTAKRVGRGLRGIRATEVPERLPRPARGSLHGDLRCQRR
jgi:hypothetical protein